MATVHASEIVPSLYEEEEDEDNEDDEEEFHEDTVDDLTYDLYNLVACDYHPLLPPASSVSEVEVEEQIREKATRATQLLVNSIFSLPIESTDVGPVAVLPSKENFRYPREKRIPEPKGLTVWEKFAKQKGIKNKKRERMVFDEQEGIFKPRFGYKGANKGEEEHAIVEVKAGDDPYADPWEEARRRKKERVSKNEKQRIRNIERLEVGKGRGKKGKKGEVLSSSSFDPSEAAGIPLDMVKKNGKRGKEGVRQALQLAQHSTASLGRYDEKRFGEPEKKIKGLKRKFSDNTSKTSLSNEKKAMKSQLRVVEDKIDKKARGVTNSLAAYEGIIPDAPTESFRARKGKKSGTDSGKSRKTATGQKKKK